MMSYFLLERYFLQSC